MSINIAGAAIAANQVLQRNQKQADGGKELKFRFYTEIDVFSMDTSCPDYTTNDEAYHRSLEKKGPIQFGLRPVDKTLGTEAATGQAAARRTGVKVWT